MKLFSHLFLLLLIFCGHTAFAQTEACFELQGIPVFCDQGSMDLKIKPGHVPLFTANTPGLATPGPNGHLTWCSVGQNCVVGQPWFNGPKVQAAHNGSVTAYIHFFGGSDWCSNTAALCDRLRQRMHVANFQLVVGGQVRAQQAIDPSNIVMEPSSFGGFYFAPNFPESPVRIGGKFITLGAYVKAGEEVSVVVTSLGKGFEVHQVEIKTIAE